MFYLMHPTLCKTLIPLFQFIKKSILLLRKYDKHCKWGKVEMYLVFIDVNVT